MIAIFKYEFDDRDIGKEAVLELPEGATVLSVGLQNDVIQLWALVDTARAPKPRKFLLAFTGRNLSVSGLRFIGRIDMSNMGLVVHVLEDAK